MFTPKFLALLSLAVAHPLAPAHPLLARSPAIDDITILNFALTLEHLENAFYSDALARFSEHDFTSAGLPPWARARFAMIGAHERAHVAFLSDALGEHATQACVYRFPYTDPASFAGLSAVLENVGVSAYAGAARYIADKDYLTAAAVVLSTEARHHAWVTSAVNKGEPWGGPLDTPLDLDSIYSLAAPFIVSCPSSNPVLPVTAYPALKLSPPNPHPGVSAKLALPPNAGSGPFTATLYYGLTVTSVPVTHRKFVMPGDAKGTVYVLVMSGPTPVAGPAIVDLSVDSEGRYIH